MRENRLYGSEGGVAKAIPTPISNLRAPVCDNTRSGREKACGAVEQEKGDTGRKKDRKRVSGDLTAGVLI
jgi:hypothetical protein